MKLLFLSKRRYMNHDVILDRYGRLYHLPYELALRGHECHCVCLSYQNSPPLVQKHLGDESAAAGKLYWYSWPAGLLGSLIPVYLYKVKKLIHSFRPDAIIGESDALHVIFAHLLSSKTGVPLFIDLYDNFESFGLYKIPGIAIGYGRALQAAKGISVVSRPLEKYIKSDFPKSPPSL